MAKLKLLQFSVQNVHLCIDFQFIDKVLQLPLLEKVPSAPLYLAGLMNMRGKAIPVIDLGLRLGLTRDQVYPINTPVLLCIDGEHEAGFIVDKIYGSVEVEEGMVQKGEEFAKEYYLGAITLDAGVSLLINVSNLVKNEHRTGVNTTHS